MKLILNTDEDEIYRAYPSRKGNIYAKSVKKIIPYKEYDFFNIPISVVKNNMRLPNDKYYGVNFLHINNDKLSQRLEFRYIGGEDYEKNIGQLIYFLERFVKGQLRPTDELKTLMKDVAFLSIDDFNNEVIEQAIEALKNEKEVIEAITSIQNIN